MNRTVRVSFFRRFVSELLVLFSLFAAETALCEQQDVPRVVPQSTARPVETDILQQIILAKKALTKELAEKSTDLKRTVTEEQQEVIRTEIQDLTARIQALDQDFESIVSGVDPTQIVVTPKSGDWQQEMREMLSPILDELKKMTAHPRELEALRQQIGFYQHRIDLAESAVRRIRRHLDAAESAEVKKELQPLLESWQHQSEEFKGRLLAARQQLTNKQTRSSLIASLGTGIRHFFRNRGRNLGLSLLVFLAIMVLLSYARQRLYQKTGLDRLGPHRTFFLRLAELAYSLGTLLLSVVAFVLVLYVSEDWMMLGLSLFLLFSMIWTGKSSLPRLWAQAKLLLNLSTVREGERVVYQGLPWKVMTLSLYTRLHNPNLRGGMLRLPLSELLGLQSRPFYTDEPWFPTKSGDLVELADGTIGVVYLQTPEQVVLDTKGGCLRTYPTLTFLGLHPINYSGNAFAVIVNFGLDYAHQAEITRTIPGLLRDYIAAALEQEEFASDLLEMLVDFNEAAASSLNLLLLLKFPGSRAASYFAVARFLRRTAVEACTEYGWNIPFMQVTLHQAEVDSAA